MDIETNNNKIVKKLKRHVSNNEKITILRERLARRLKQLERLEDFTSAASESQLQHKLWEQYNNAKNNIYNMRSRVEIVPDAIRPVYSVR